MSALVAASLWSEPADRRGETADRLAAAGLARWHWDVSDGRFTVPGGFDPEEAGALMARTGVPGEAHLMVLDPVRHAPAWAEICRRVVVHVEAAGWRDAVALTREAGAAAAVAVSPDTPLESVVGLDPDVGVLVMSVRPGHAGAAFLPATVGRVGALAGRAALGVDGGVTRDLARECRRAGATWVVSGTDLCASPDPAGWLADLAAP